jgi:hypothetical protein
MPRFRVIHLSSGEEWEVEAGNQVDALNSVGWTAEVCQVFQLERGPYAVIDPPKIAVQTVPPIPGRVHICPDCNVTLVEKKGDDFWLRCPSCDLLYHEWENKIYRNRQE